MTKIIKSDLTKEMIEKAMQCKTADNSWSWRKPKAMR